MTKAVRKLINLKQHYNNYMSTHLAEHLNLFKKTRRILSVRLEVQRENLRKTLPNMETRNTLQGTSKVKLNQMLVHSRQMEILSQTAVQWLQY